jgi:hypothetical protein
MAHSQQLTRLDSLHPRRGRARKALDTWTPSPEIRIAVELEDAFREGVKRAAAFLQEKGQRELAALVRRLAEGES